MKAGKMKTKIVAESPELVREPEYGSMEEVWTPKFSRSAQKLTLTGKEYYISDELFSQSSHKFILRWDRVAAAITNKYRLNINGSYFDVKKCFDPTDDRKKLIIVANSVEL